MRVLAFDIGDARIGIAWGDTNSQISSPVTVLSSNEVVNRSKLFLNILDEYCPEKLVFGLPKSLDGQTGLQAVKVREIAIDIADSCNLPYDFVDERMSSKEAKRILQEQGLNEKQMRGKVDSVAASLFLDTWLENNKD